MKDLSGMLLKVFDRQLWLFFIVFILEVKMLTRGKPFRFYAALLLRCLCYSDSSFNCNYTKRRCVYCTAFVIDGVYLVETVLF